jgi:glycosyltransferase involved in cell wall biosynthesis
MKIVQFMASQGWGGAESVFVELANEQAKSHHVTAFLLRGTEYSGRFTADVHLVNLISNPTRHNPFLLYEIYSRLKVLQPDIIHTHAVKGTELVYNANRFLNLPHVGTKHNVRKGKIFNRLRWVTAVSEASRQTVHSVQPSRVEVIHNGVIPVNVENIPKNAVFTILAIGRLDRVKGFDILIDQLQELDLDFRLLVVGEGPERSNLEETIRKAKMDQRVQLIGFRDDIPQLMKAAHAVVVSSHTEGFSKVLVEGLFYADVVVSTPVGVAVELLPLMFLTEQNMLGKKIVELYRNYEQFVNEFKNMVKRKSEDFLISEIVDKYITFYREIIGRQES